jgi:methylthioribose-1-phosphate isomerase
MKKPSFYANVAWIVDPGTSNKYFTWIFDPCYGTRNITRIVDPGTSISPMNLKNAVLTCPLQGNFKDNLMLVNGKPQRTIWLNSEDQSVLILDQTQLPHHVYIQSLQNVQACALAIAEMQVRGAPLIGAAGAYGMYLAMREDASDKNIDFAYELLLKTRPTAVNLRWALNQCRHKLINTAISERMHCALKLATEIADDDARINFQLGRYTAQILQDIWERRKHSADRLNILTHCNAGWLATVDWGTALSGVYQAALNNIPLHVWVDETRPRNQGASLTAWELKQQNIPHTVIVDNAGGHLMQHGQVDCCIVGTDRTTARGDVCNKIGTYLKALSAFDNNIPFYVAAPASSIDFQIENGLTEIEIEERGHDEIALMKGRDEQGNLVTISILPDNTVTKNYGFDVTPAKYITAIITERGVCNASKEGLKKLFPEHYKDNQHAESMV